MLPEPPPRFLTSLQLLFSEPLVAPSTLLHLTIDLDLYPKDFDEVHLLLFTISTHPDSPIFLLPDK